MEDQEQFGDLHAALASDKRRLILELLLHTNSPVDAATVAARIDLHVTTARFHLEQLESAGLIRREVERAGQRGRPRILFTAGPSAREDGAQQGLSRALASALAEDQDGGRARAIRAGEEWSAAYMTLATDGATATDEAAATGTGSDTGSDTDSDTDSDTGTDGAAPLVRILEKLGFDPQNDDGRIIELRACPFRDEARRAPAVVCSVHLGLIRGVAASLGHSPSDTELRPFVGPELCQVQLHGNWTGRSTSEQA